jgi:uncharacterized protein
MKPADHPEFFRFPAPEGRSRESSIVLDKDGRFFHDGARVEHAGMQKAFASWLARHPDDGRYILSNGYDWTYVTVEGPACFVTDISSATEPPQLVLFDGRELPLDPAALRSDRDGRLWARLPGGGEACFSAAAQLGLAPRLVERDGRVGVELAGRFAPIEADDAP